jgi:hypothetical protein
MNAVTGFASGLAQASLYLDGVMLDTASLTVGTLAILLAASSPSQNNHPRTARSVTSSELRFS